MKKIGIIRLISIIGSIFIILGSLLPWITFLGGLQTFSGVSGLNGKILLVSGITTLLLIGVSIIRNLDNTLWLTRIIGFFQFAFCSYLTINLVRTFHTLSTDPMNNMMVGGIGPGLFIATFGALLLFCTFFFQIKKVDSNKNKQISYTNA
jgi:hypothetical protein